MKESRLADSKEAMPILSPIQTMQRMGPRQTTHGDFVNASDPFLKSPDANEGLRKEIVSEKGDQINQPSDGLSHPELGNERSRAEAQETVEDQDIAARHKDLINFFNNNPSAMANPYVHLEQNRWVLELDDEDNNFLRRVVTKIKDLERRGEDKLKEQWTKGIYKIIPWVITHNADLLDRTGEFSALEDASKRCVHVAYCMLNLLLDQKSQETLRSHCNGTSCSIDRSHPLISYIMETNQQANKDCPHKYGADILQIHHNIKGKLAKAAQQYQSKMSCLHHMMGVYCASPDRVAVEQLVRLSGEEIMLRSGDASREQLLHIVVKIFERPKEQDRKALEDLRDIIKTVVEVYPNTLYGENENGRTAYAELLRYREQGRLSKGIATGLRSDVLEVLKEAYIGDVRTSHHVKVRYLYPAEVDERKICLDLGLYRPIGENYIKAITEQRFDTFRFETCLSYVSLPPRKHARMLGGRLDGLDFLNTYKAIFDFLEKQGVTKIFKIIVNDLIGTPHSDRSIVELTQNFDIEHWEWKKLDINSDTILQAAPNVKTVELHSSGSYAALQGWACKHGLAKLQHLETVKVEIHRGVEDNTSLQKYMEDFKRGLKRRFEKNGKVIKVHADLKDAVPYSADYPNDSGQDDLVGRAKENHDWLNHMNGFTVGMRNYDYTDELPCVKVALIDDGIDPEKTRFKVHEGRTFDETGDTGLDNYYVDHGRHGTVMGRLISMMCPNVQLYVARIKRAPNSDIPAVAAKEAVRWAVEKRVDIISMSWTMPAKGPNPKEIEDFQAAVAEAVKHKKLLFCALRESEDALIEQGFYPVGLNQVFKIGSATRSGNLVKTHSGDGKTVQFILPGLEVLLEHETGVKTLHGSSVATALASGLAALILFCAELVDQDAASSSNPRNFGRSLRDIAKMKSVFENMSRKSNDGKFPEVQKYFKIAGKDPAIEDIRDLITSLTSGVL